MVLNEQLFYFGPCCIDHAYCMRHTVYISKDYIRPKLFKPSLKDSGAIVEIGSHEELLKKKGAYFSLINTQL